MGAYMGKGGAVFEIAVPADGSVAREHFDSQVASGDLVEVKAEVKKTPPVAKPAAKAKADS
jgi:hypothetical protein